jgi:hypothetical protein
MNQFFSTIGQQVFRYIGNNLVDCFTRLGGFILSAVGSYFAANPGGKGLILGLLLNNTGPVTRGDQQYAHVVLAAVDTLPVAMLLGVGGTLLFWLLGRRVAVLAIEGPQLRRWSRILFSTGFVLTLMFLIWQLPSNGITLAMIRQDGTRLAYAAGALGCLAVIYVLTFVAAFYAFASPNLRVIAAPWPLRHLFRGLARATMA